jgi:hypothetical protein
MNRPYGLERGGTGVRRFSGPNRAGPAGDALWRARTLLYGAGARILGLALNEVDFRRDSYGYSSKFSYYRYGYGDGYGREERESSAD